MNLLVRKDYRLNRPFLGLVVIVPALIHVLIMIAVWNTPDARDLPNIAAGLAVSTALSVSLSSVMLAFAGGNAFAGERFERSAEFLAYLPISRGRILAAKLQAALGLFALIWLPHLAILLAIGQDAGSACDAVREVWILLRILPLMGAAAFGVAWASSAMSRSPILPTCLGILAPAATALTFYGLAFLFLRLVNVSHEWEPTAPLIAEACYAGLNLLVAVAGIAVGTIYYLRRVEA